MVLVGGRGGGLGVDRGRGLMAFKGRSVPGSPPAPGPVGSPVLTQHSHSAACVSVADQVCEDWEVSGARAQDLLRTLCHSCDTCHTGFFWNSGHTRSFQEVSLRTSPTDERRQPAQTCVHLLGFRGTWKQPGANVHFNHVSWDVFVSLKRETTSRNITTCCPRMGLQETF